MVVNIAIQSELNLRENKWYPYRLRPFHFNLSVRPVTGKFYARHDYLDFSLLDEEIEAAVEKHYGGQNKDRQPLTTSMEYGWYTVEEDLELRQRFHYPKRSSWVTQIGAEIAKQDQKNPKKIFKGLPFKI